MPVIMNTAISARVVVELGQYCSGLVAHPAVIARSYIVLMTSKKPFDGGTSVKVSAVSRWVIETGWLLTLSVPVRSAPVVLAGSENVTVPFPLPLAPEVMPMNAALADATQEQAGPVVTLSGGADWLVESRNTAVGLTLSVQVAEATVRVTGTVIAMEPD